LLRFSHKFLTLIFAAFVVGVAGNYFVFKSTQYLVIIKGFVGLLSTNPEKIVAIIESEKFAIIAISIIPELVWLAAGNLNGLSVEKCQILKGRNVMLYPDLGAFEKWSLKAVEIQKQNVCKISISTLLENESTDIDRANGLDIADFIISELKSKKTIPEIQSFFNPTLQSMIDKNKALLVLISDLQLEEVL